MFLHGVPDKSFPEAMNMNLGLLWRPQDVGVASVIVGYLLRKAEDLVWNQLERDKYVEGNEVERG